MLSQSCGCCKLFGRDIQCTRSRNIVDDVICVKAEFRRMARSFQSSFKDGAVRFSRSHFIGENGMIKGVEEFKFPREIAVVSFTSVREKQEAWSPLFEF